MSSKLKLSENSDFAVRISAENTSIKKGELRTEMDGQSWWCWQRIVGASALLSFVLTMIAYWLL